MSGKILNLFGINYGGEFVVIAFMELSSEPNINRYRRRADSEVKVQRKIGGSTKDDTAVCV